VGDILSEFFPSHKDSLLLSLFVFIVLPSCQSIGNTIVLVDEVTPPLNNTQTHTPTIITTTPTYTPTITPTPTETPFPESVDCLRPPDDMTVIEVNGQKLNQRTYAMLQHAAKLYSGKIDIIGQAITQGSYTRSVALSFGTHSGGGAVDLSVIDTSTGHWVVLEDEIEPLIDAMRVAGFAAWLRDYGELATNSPIHIHAIAIGDPELSSIAEEQLVGDFGYFRGFDGLPQDNGIPLVDRHGGPILCKWMWELGYSDLRISP